MQGKKNLLRVSEILRGQQVNISAFETTRNPKKNMIVLIVEISLGIHIFSYKINN